MLTKKIDFFLHKSMKCLIFDIIITKKIFLCFLGKIDEKEVSLFKVPYFNEKSFLILEKKTKSTWPVRSGPVSEHFLELLILNFLPGSTHLVCVDSYDKRVVAYRIYIYCIYIFFLLMSFFWNAFTEYICVYIL